MLKSFFDLFLKANCPLCKRSAKLTLCLDCEKQIKQLTYPNSQIFWQGELPVFIWGTYTGIFKRAIAALKYDQKTDLGRLFGYWLGEKWLASPLAKTYPKLTVIPIPLHAEKLKIRGFNQAEIIAQGFCQITRYNLKAQGLKRIKKTEALFGLSPSARAKEIKDSLILGQDFHKKLPSDPVLLLDDIYTTGTTVKEAKKILEQHQIKVIGVVAIASSKRV